MREVVGFIAAGLTGVVLCGASLARAGASSSSDSLVVAQAQLPAVVIGERPPATPPTMLAQTAINVTPVVAAQPAPAVAASVVVAQGSIVRAVTPNGSQPGVFWLIAIGAVLCRMGARLLRVS